MGHCIFYVFALKNVGRPQRDWFRIPRYRSYEKTFWGYYRVLLLRVFRLHKVGETSDRLISHVFLRKHVKMPFSDFFEGGKWNGGFAYS